MFYFLFKIPPREILFSGVFLFVFTLLSIQVSATDTQDHYFIRYTDAIKTTYFNIVDLKMDLASRQLEKFKKNNPHNLAILHLENLKDFLVIFINEDMQKFQQSIPEYHHRINVLNKHGIDDPYLNYIKGEIHLQWGLIYLKFGKWYDAFISIKKAYNTLEKNQKKYPDFLPNYKSLGILHAVIGTIPSEYQWGLQLLTGMEGDLQQGQKEIERVLKNSNPETFLFYRETLAMYVLLQLNLKNNPEKAWELIQNSDVNLATEPLSCFAFANIAMRTGRNELAIKYLKKYPREPEYMNFSYMDFMLGIAYLRKLDKKAILYLQRFIEEYPGHNYVKEAYQKIAWYNLIFKGATAYHKALDQVLSNGTMLVEADKSAESEATHRNVPNTTLLKAQLLFDGGYYKAAYQLLLEHSNELYLSEKYSYEYTYRLARTVHKMGELKEAIAYYEQLYNAGKNRPEYYACNAALQLGLIAENQFRFNTAKKWFQRCLQLSPDNYAPGIHQQAEAGLERLEEIKK